MELPFDVHEADRIISASDRKLARVITEFGPCQMKIRSVASPFEALFRSIVFQQLSTRAATTIYNRVIDLYSPNKPTPEATLRLPEEEMRGAGMSWAKIASTKDLAEKSIEGTVPALHELEMLPDHEIIDRLTTVRGIGRWTVEMMLMFSLGRPDVLPSTDLAIRKGFQQIYSHEEMSKPKEIEKYGERWRPFRTIASWYLWRVMDGDNDEW